MPMKKLFFFVAVVVALAGGWFLRGRWLPSGAVPEPASGRRVLFYQSPMHPHITSDRPGQCTICGMDLVPVYEGQAGAVVSPGLVTLSPGSISVIDVQTSPVVRQPLRRTLNVAGTLENDDSRRRILSAYVEGRLDTLSVTFDGAEVVEGDPLARIYSPTLLGAVREYLTLSRGSPTGSPLALAAAQRLVQYGLSDAQIARLPTTFTETNLHVELLAPMTGTVVSRKVSAGQTVTQGQELFEVADFSTLWFQFIAYEQDLPWLQPGQTVEISVPAVPGRVFTNTITFINPNLDPATRTTQVRVPVPNPLVESDGQKRRLLSHRLYGSARVNVAFPDVLTIPRSAVLDPGGRPLVFVETAVGTYQARPVTQGRWGDMDVEILEGLSTGERVVTSGALLLDAQAQLNTATQVVPREASAKPSSPVVELAPAQREAFRVLFSGAAGLAQTLAADDLAAFNAALPPVHSQAAALTAAMGTAPEWAALISPLNTASHLDPAPDLPAARREFNRFAEAVIPLAQRLRATDPEFAQLKVYRCPMTRKSFPGAPARAGWLQLAGPLRNPYFGAEMIDCGSEVAP